MSNPILVSFPAFINDSLLHPHDKYKVVKNSEGATLGLQRMSVAEKLFYKLRPNASDLVSYEVAQAAIELRDEYNRSFSSELGDKVSRFGVGLGTFGHERVTFVVNLEGQNPPSAEEAENRERNLGLIRERLQKVAGMGAYLVGGLTEEQLGRLNKIERGMLLAEAYRNGELASGATSSLASSDSAQVEVQATGNIHRYFRMRTQEQRTTVDTYFSTKYGTKTVTQGDLRIKVASADLQREKNDFLRNLRPFEKVTKPTPAEIAAGASVAVLKRRPEGIPKPKATKPKETIEVQDAPEAPLRKKRGKREEKLQAVIEARARRFELSNGGGLDAEGVLTGTFIDKRKAALEESTEAILEPSVTYAAVQTPQAVAVKTLEASAYAVVEFSPPALEPTKDSIYDDVLIAPALPPKKKTPPATPPKPATPSEAVLIDIRKTAEAVAARLDELTPKA